ncbi:magnesium-translocating P-type ATPase [Numidum massiliense]|uniref:magnesium-translocating P-type ATPase n=1 Tax=Numidum massiliense TaxID=1522315 RepID=UPI0006D58CE5|nr:magnesium-translocating P-type ATPase [Numidum massiliense]
MRKPANDREKLTQKIAEQLIQASLSSEEALLKDLDTNRQGLTETEAKKRLERHGKNEIVHEKLPSWYMQLLACFKNPFILILLSLATFAYIIDNDLEAVIIIATMVTISVLITFTQEFRSMRTAEKLKAMVKTTSTVIRRSEDPQQARQQKDGQQLPNLLVEQKEIDMELLVPGDMIHLSAGDMVPADVRLIASKDVHVGEAALTGEAMPVEKMDIMPSSPKHGHTATQTQTQTQTQAQAQAQASSQKQTTPPNALELSNMCYMGTNIVSGSATAVVVATGTDTYFGAMASTLLEKPPLTSFDKGIRSVTFVLIRFMAIMVPIIFFVNGFTKGDWLQALLFGLSVAVGLTPEMLPMIVASNLAKGAATLARNKVVVKQLNAIQNLGAMDILCSDKTGTLTQDKIILAKHLDLQGQKDLQVLEYAYLNSFHQTGLKNLLDVAVLQYAEDADIRNKYTKIDEIPFDFNRRRMSVVLERQDGEHLLICKGAMEEVLRISTHAYKDGQIVPLTATITKRVQQLADNMNADGLRVLAVAVKQPGARKGTYGLQDEKDLTLVGYLAFLDPPKETAKTAIKALQEHSVDVKVITGDNEAVTRKVCKDVGIHIEHLLLGNDVDAMSEEQLAVAAEKTTVFAKVNPLQKARIVRALKNNGHTVGFIGDGINDAISLKEADVGISVDTAVDIAKDSADIILLEKSLLVLEQGVVEGRKTFGNMIKYIKMTVSSNFGNMFSVLVASAFIPFLPMLPIQLLIQNLLYDISQLAVPWDTMDEEFLRKPQQWDAKSVGRFTLFIGPISSIFDMTTFALMWYVFAANTVESQALFHSGWFVLGLLSQTLIVHMIRTEKIPFVQSKASTPVMVLTGLIMALGTALPFTGVGASIGLQPLPLAYFPWLVATLLAYSVVTQAVKKWYIYRFNEWL